jgi:hypothetical protein
MGFGTISIKHRGNDRYRKYDQNHAGYFEVHKKEINGLCRSRESESFDDGLTEPFEDTGR